MRLVDADELIEHAWRDKLDSRELIAKMIDNAPTVKEIPTKIPINVFEKLISQDSVIDKIRAEIETARFVDKDTKLCKNANASGLEVAMQIIDKYRESEE